MYEIVTLNTLEQQQQPATTTTNNNNNTTNNNNNTTNNNNNCNEDWYYCTSLYFGKKWMNMQKSYVNITFPLVKFFNNQEHNNDN